MDRETVDEIKRHFEDVAAGIQRHSDEALERARQDLESKIDRLHEHFDVSVAEMQRYLGVFAEHQDSKLQWLAEGINKRIDGVESRLVGIESRLTGLSQIVQLTYEEVTGRLDDHDKRIGALERRQP